MINEKCHKNCNFLYEIYFLHGHFYFNVKNPLLFSIKRFSLKIANKFCYKRLKYSKFMHKKKKKNRACYEKR